MLPLHGIGSRQDLPLPFEFVLGGAVAALILSFVLLVWAWRRPRWTRDSGLPLPRLTRLVDAAWFRWSARVAFAVPFAAAALGLWAGQDRLTNPVFRFVFVLMWVGLVPFSLLLGPAWRALNPLRLIALPGTARATPSPVLKRLGVWPAAGALLAFAWLELVQPGNSTLPVMRIWALAWLAWTILPALRLGGDWIGAADPFEVFATTVSRLSPWRRVEDTICLVNPLRGLLQQPWPPGSAAVVCVLLGTTAYDSFSGTTWWVTTVQGSDVPGAVWATAGLIGLTGIVAALFAIGCLAMRPALRTASSMARLTREMAPSVVPIVVGYSIAHYLTLLVIEGQRAAIQLSDPLGKGWNLFGTAELGVDARLANAPGLVAIIQLGAIVGGHILGIMTAHERSVQLLRPERQVVGQLGMLTIMVAFTCAGLLLLFSP